MTTEEIKNMMERPRGGKVQKRELWKSRHKHKKSAYARRENN
jgi:hypothetical protein